MPGSRWRHSEHEHRHRERSTDAQAPAHVLELVIGLLFRDRDAPLQRHPADRAVPRRVRLDLRVHRARPGGIRVRGNVRVFRHFLGHAGHGRLRLLGERQVPLRIRLEAVAADGGAEVERAAAVLECRRGLLRAHVHPAHGIAHRVCQDRQLTLGHLENLRQDRARRRHTSMIDHHTGGCYSASTNRPESLAYASVYGARHCRRPDSHWPRAAKCTSSPARRSAASLEGRSPHGRSRWR